MENELTFETDDELLSAFVDGELPDDAVAALTARLTEEPQLVRRLEALRGVDIAVTEAYSEIDNLPMPEAVLAQFEKESATDNVVAFPERGIRRFFQAPVALAASVALLAGIVGTHVFLQESPGLSPAGTLAAGKVPSGTDLHQMLELSPSGEVYDLDGSSADVLLTFVDQAGDWCRQVRVLASDHSVHGVACRRGDAWQVEAIALGEAGASDGQYGTAAITVPEAMDSAVNLLIGDRIPLDLEEENLTISEGWKKPEN